MHTEPETPLFTSPFITLIKISPALLEVQFHQIYKNTIIKAASTLIAVVQKVRGFSLPSLSNRTGERDMWCRLLNSHLTSAFIAWV